MSEGCVLARQLSSNCKIKLFFTGDKKTPIRLEIDYTDGYILVNLPMRVIEEIVYYYEQYIANKKGD